MIQQQDLEKKVTMVIKFDDRYQPEFIYSADQASTTDFKIESVLFDNALGNTLNAWLIEPELVPYNGTSILFLHGNAGNITTHYQNTIPLVKAGFKVFIIDYSGFGFSTGEATRDNVLLDAEAALEYLLKRKDLNAERLIIYGQSLGGHLSAVVASEHQEKIDALVIEGAFSSHKDIAADKGGIFGRLFISEKYSAVESIASFKKPVLIIHSKEDEVVPFEMGGKLFQAANEPKLFYEIDGCHICGTLNYAEEIISRINQLILEE